LLSVILRFWIDVVKGMRPSNYLVLAATDVCPREVTGNPACCIPTEKYQDT